MSFDKMHISEQQPPNKVTDHFFNPEEFPSIFVVSFTESWHKRNSNLVSVDTDCSFLKFTINKTLRLLSFATFFHLPCFGDILFHKNIQFLLINMVVG